MGTVSCPWRAHSAGVASHPSEGDMDMRTASKRAHYNCSSRRGEVFSIGTFK